MPKGSKRKGKSDRSRFDGSQESDDDSYNNDAASVLSNYSENRSSEETDETDELAQEQFEDKLCEYIEGLTQKSSQGRTNCFQTLSKALVKKFVPSFIRERNFTLCDSVERSLKKGGGAEKAAAAELATLMCIQLGAEDASEAIYKTLKPVLMTLALDNSASPVVRGKCCLAVANMAFLSGGEMGEILLIMQQLESIYSGSYLKGDGSVPTITAETATMHASAISAWCLLFTLMAPGNITSMMNNSKNLPSLEQLSELLESAHLEVRMAAGEALALIFELGRQENEDFEDDFAQEITETLKQLATDSHKYRAKKDRKQQRATFRDILQFIENDTTSDVQVKFGREVLVLDTWTRRKQYDTMCNILGPGINIHLAENDLLRDIFEIMGSPVQNEGPLHQQMQLERNRKRLLNAANFKARTISRAKNRDKRSDF